MSVGSGGFTTRADATLTEGGDDDPSSKPSLLGRLFGFGQENDTTEEVVERPKTGAGAEIEAERARGEREIYINLRRMRGMRVSDVMVPRADIDSVALETGLSELLEAFRETARSRLPVYHETLDDPRGFVHLKDVALNFGFEGVPTEQFKLEDLLRPMLYVPPSMPIGALLEKMQNARMHMALVIDEYGGVDGLITIEDLLEQIVGEIEDEHDEEETADFVEMAEGVYIASARAELPEFEEVAGVDLLPDDLDEDVDTLGGLIFILAGRVPERGEVITHPQGHEFEILDADARRVKRVRVRLASATKTANFIAPPEADKTPDEKTAESKPAPAASPKSDQTPAPSDIDEADKSGC